MQLRVDEIRGLVPDGPGTDNPVDLLSRGIDCCELGTSVLQSNGPKWLTGFEGLQNRKEIAEDEACLIQVLARDREIATTALAMNSDPTMLGDIILSEAFSNLNAFCELQHLFWGSLNY